MIRRTRAAAGRVNLAGLLFVVLVAALAEVAIRLFDFDDVVATPTASGSTLVEELRSGALSDAIGATLAAYVEGLGIAIVVGVAAGIALGTSRMLLDASSVVIEFLRPIPAVALIPLATLVFGLDTEMRRFLVAFAAVWPILFNTLYGVRGVDRLLYDVARTSRATRLGTLGRVTLPAALPSIATGIRISASIALLVCVTAEWINQTAGLGAYMARQYGSVPIQLDKMYAAVLLTALLGLGINALLRATERRVVFWAGDERSAAR